MNKKIINNITVIVTLLLLSLCVLLLAIILQTLTSQTKIRSSNNNITESSNNPSNNNYIGNNESNNNPSKNEESSKSANSSKGNLAKFMIGSTIAEVREAQGNPIDVLRTGTSQETWFYGNSRIFFEDGIVVEVDDIDDVFNFITTDKED